MGQFSPDRGEIYGIQTGLRGWTSLQGLGPNYFLAPAIEELLLDFVYDSLDNTAPLSTALAAQRANVVNFFELLSGQGAFTPTSSTARMAETTVFLRQLKEQVLIWRSGTFKSLDFSMAERAMLARISVKASPVLFFMGFADAIPHSSQVARLCASMAHRLDGRHSEIFQAAVVGKLHDPKFEPNIDVARQNLATHPINAVALASCIFEDEQIKSALLAYFHGNHTLCDEFIEGVRDALGVNNDSWFVQMMFILPNFVKRIGGKYGAEVAAGFQSVMEGRLRSASLCSAPPMLPTHLHGCLAQESLDSGLRGISHTGWIQAVTAAGIEGIEPKALFQQLLDGQLGTVTQDQIAALRKSLRENPNAILTANISATRLLHHHQEVVPSGRIAAAALVIADPMMLSPHKVASVYVNTLLERLQSYCKSFDDNIRLLPCAAKAYGVLWQRAVYLSMLLASDRLTGSARLTEFRASHVDADVNTQLEDMRKLVLDPQTWGTFATAAGPADDPNVRKALDALEAAYVAVVAQYREAVQTSDVGMDKFFPES